MREADSQGGALSHAQARQLARDALLVLQTHKLGPDGLEVAALGEREGFAEAERVAREALVFVVLRHAELLQRHNTHLPVPR